MKNKIFLVLLFIFLSTFSKIYASPTTGFTQEDRERLIRLETTLKVFMDQTNKRFDHMMNFLWMLVAIFTTITGVTIGFAFWDRRTMIKRAKEETVDEIEKEGKLKDLIKALRELAVYDKQLADVLKNFGLL